MTDLSPAQHPGRRNGKSAAAFRTISEVAAALDVPTHVLRFWETKFSQVRPLKRGGGRRYYRPEDIDLLRRIRELLYSDGYTIKGVQKLLREGGAMRCVISTESDDHATLVAKAKAAPSMAGSDFVKEVTVAEPYVFDAEGEKKYDVVALDFGIKTNILRLLAEAGCRVTVLPATATAEEILAQHPNGIFLSNGPGDPAALDYIYPVVRALFDSGVPIFGICLGHQILGHALGGKTFKLKFGHRGANQPVMNQATGRVEITAQNHGFAIDPESLDTDAIELTHLHLNDKTCSGLRHKTLPLFSVQYHPEASPGPHDSRYLFAQFTALMDAAKAKQSA